MTILFATIIHDMNDGFFFRIMIKRLFNKVGSLYTCRYTEQTDDKVNACCICVCQKNAFTRIITTTNAYTRTVYASACNAFFHTYVRSQLLAEV